MLLIGPYWTGFRSADRMPALPEGRMNFVLEVDQLFKLICDEHFSKRVEIHPMSCFDYIVRTVKVSYYNVTCLYVVT